jgi:hypothetical protein
MDLSFRLFSSFFSIFTRKLVHSFVLCLGAPLSWYHGWLGRWLIGFLSPSFFVIATLGSLLAGGLGDGFSRNSQFESF